MAQAVLVASSKVIPRQTLRRLSIAELNSEVKKRKRSIFDDNILKKLGYFIRAPDKPIKDYVPYSDDVDPDSVNLPDDNDPINKDGTSVFEKPITNQWINAELNLPQGEKFQNAKVISQSKYGNGVPIGSYDINPFLNTTIYDVGFPDGEICEYCANVISENMYSQVDAEGYRYQLLDNIVDHKQDGNAIHPNDLYINKKSGQKHMRQTTSGWNLLVQWKNGTQEWVPLKIFKI